MWKEDEVCGRVSAGRRPPLSSGLHQPCLPMLPGISAQCL